MDLNHFSLKLLLLFFSCMAAISISYGYDSLEPNGNITTTWDILVWDPSTYDVRLVSVYNYQLLRHVDRPREFSLGLPGYTCGDPFEVALSNFAADYGRRHQQTPSNEDENKAQSDAPSWLCIVFLSFVQVAIIF